MGDGILLGADVLKADVRFEVRVRPAGSDLGSGDDVVLFGVENHFVRRVPGGFLATPFAADASGAAAGKAGDQLVLRITTLAGDPGVFFVPNGDGARGQGEIPHIDLPR